MSAGRQLRDNTREIKNIGLRLNQFLYVDGNLRKNKATRIPTENYTVDECLTELEELRNLIWWLYQDNQDFGDASGYNLNV